MTGVVACAGLCFPQAAVSQTSDGSWSRATKTGVVSDSRIREASGISRSTFDRSTLYVHNDSGDSARFFALTPSGDTAGVFTLPGAPSLDWEDVATGPGHNLWFGDIGDNQTRKDYISVIRVQEPQDLTSRSLSSTTFKLRYPDGIAHNAEALMVHPTSGQVYVITKQKTGGTIYRAPLNLQSGSMNQLTPVGSAPVTVTGGDFAPSGDSFVLRTYGKAYVYNQIGGTPTVVNLPTNGESIGFNRAGSLVIHSEGTFKPIWRIDR